MDYDYEKEWQDEFAELLFQTEGEGSYITLPDGREVLVDY